MLDFETAFNAEEDLENLGSYAPTYDSLDACINEAMNIDFGEVNMLRTMTVGHNQKKKHKMDHLCPIAFIQFNTRSAGKPKPVTLKALLDSGASASIVHGKCAQKLKKRCLVGYQNQL